ncbi:Gfo/Idh/MocA family protein [Streptomyces sp. NPDC005794]|uniref:Gfo/Idh/MocA family protein n=1 Tax=Streptomyces sp. NPDC005794 TaxID=3364733 RepID=UPI0036811D44
MNDPALSYQEPLAGARPERRHLVVGTGAIAHAHAAAVAAHPRRAAVVSAVDIDARRAEDFAAGHGIPHWSTDLAQALQGRPDLAHICTPPGSHVPLALQCVEAGVPVLLEKPPALSLAELDELLEASERTGVDVSVVFQHRFGAAGLEVRQLLAEGSLGRPLVAVCDTMWYRPPEYFAVPWRGKWEVEGGGPTMGHGIHQFDLLLALLGGWTEVSAMAGRLARDTATEDVSTALVRFDNGALATIVNSLLSPRETSHLRIDTELATVEVEHLYGYSKDDWTITPVPGRESVSDSLVSVTADGQSGHADQVGAVLDAMDAGEPLPVPLREARDTMELVAAVYASAFTGRAVRKGEIVPGHPFYSRMDGTGAPWAESHSLEGASL